MFVFTGIGVFVTGVLGLFLLGTLLAYIWCIVPVIRIKKLKRLEQKNKKLRDNLKKLGIKYKELKDKK